MYKEKEKRSPTSNGFLKNKYTINLQNHAYCRKSDSFCRFCIRKLIVLYNIIISVITATAICSFVKERILHVVNIIIGII